MTTHLIADPHFGHEGIIRLCGRPFANVVDMNNTMSKSWNAVVRPTDDVIVVGDFSHRMEPTALRKLFDSLAGRKHLVPGNHDDEHTLALPWATPPKDIRLVSIDGTRVVLCHYALRTWPGIMRSPGALMLYGHNHGRLPCNSQSMDIGVDVMGWAPVRLAAIKQRLAQLPPLRDPEATVEIEPDGGVKP